MRVEQHNQQECRDLDGGRRTILITQIRERAWSINPTKARELQVRDMKAPQIKLTDPQSTVEQKEEKWNASIIGGRSNK